MFISNHIDKEVHEPHPLIIYELRVREACDAHQPTDMDHMYGVFFIFDDRKWTSFSPMFLLILLLLLLFMNYDYKDGLNSQIYIWVLRNHHR